MFLRLIEYYKGILFLTTNRAGNFDEAFKNRIHVIIEYQNPDAAARCNIWRHLLTKRQNGITLDESWTETEYEILGELEINGRDIRNLIRTAYGYAKSHGKPLGVRHVQMVMTENCTANNVSEVAKKLDNSANRTATWPPEESNEDNQNLHT